MKFPPLLLLSASLCAVPACAAPPARPFAQIPAAQISQNTTAAGWTASADARLETRDGALHLISVGNDPNFASGILPAANGPYALEMRVSSSLQNAIQVFWATEAAPAFSNANKVERTSEAAHNGRFHDVVVPLPATLTQGVRQLRVDFGEGKGEVVFEWLRLIGADGKIVASWGNAPPAATLIADNLDADKMLKPYEYQNPIATEPVRDPQISKFGDTYWMTATCWSFFEQLGQNPGVKIWSSKDLKHWDFRTMAVLPNFNGWDAARFWAPEMHFINGKYWLTYNAMSVAGKTTQYIGLAVADDPKGPYRKITVDAPLCPGNDAHLFQDDDGKVYLFRSGINASEIDLESGKLVGEFFPVIAKGAKGEWDGGNGVSIEGPYMIKRDGTYFMFYSSWGRGYEVGIATAKNIKGPWTKAPNNPIYGAQKIENTKRYGTKYTQAPDVPWGEVGHGSPFEGPDGKLWIGGHGYKKGDKIWDAKLVIDPLKFENGMFQVETPTWTPQSVDISATKP